MTRKDYRMLAKVLGETFASYEVADRLIVELLKDNPRFDADRFRVAVQTARAVARAKSAA